MKKMIDFTALSRKKILAVITVGLTIGLLFYLPGHIAVGQSGNNNDNENPKPTTNVAFPCNEPALAGTSLAPTGAKVPPSYFGPPPASVDPTLIGPVLLLKSATTIDLKACTITIPLYLGHMKDGTNVWYILTDTNDKGTADLLGILFSPKLNYINAGKDGTQLYRTATLGPKGDVVFDQGTVQFGLSRVVVPGAAPNYFPPSKATPGSIGSKDYSPIVRFTNNPGVVLNAPIVAFDVAASGLNFCDGNVDYSHVLNNVVKICPDNMTVTLKLVPSFSFGRPTLYIAIESSDPVIAAIEGDTFVPLLAQLTTGLDDGAFSPLERLFPIVNGQMGVNNPTRQGLDSALAGQGAPLTVLGGIPTDATDYSPLWDLNPAVWNQTAVDHHFNGRLTGEFEVLGLVAQGWMTGLNGGPFGSSGIVNNCPIAFRLL